MDDNETTAPPRITGAPDAIWLVYGELEHDDTHLAFCRDGEVTWCEDSQYPSDVRYVRADLYEAQAAEIERLRTALRIAREGYASEAATGLPVLPQWRGRTLAMIDAATNGAKDAEDERLHAVSSCGHPASLMLKSAETGADLYCELCDEKSGRRDAESLETEMRAEIERLKRDNANLCAAAIRKGE